MRKFFFSLLLLYSFVFLYAQSTAQKIDELLKAYATQNKLNGAVLVAQNGNILYQKAFGFRDAEHKLPNEVNSIFQVGSLTKQITAAVIMQLQQEGKLSVSDKLDKYFPGFKNGGKITIENLLTHTSGIYNYTNDSVIMKNDVTKHYSRDYMMALFKKYPSDFEPGTNWNYSNSAYSILGYIIEKVENKPYETVVRQRIFQPLGMTSTGFDFTHLSSTEKTKGYFTLSPVPLPAPIVDSTIAYAAGAIYSTVGDFYKWESAISTNKILNPESWKSVFTPFKNNYGYGWGIDTLFGRTITLHSGGIHGYSSFVLRIPQDETTIIVFDNSSSLGLGKMSKAIAAVLYNHPYVIPAAPAGAKPDKNVLQQYIGEYELAPGFIITISLGENGLKGQATGQPAFDLFYEKENLFFLKMVDAKIEFVKGKDGAVTELILYQNGQQPHGKKIK